ncbi:MAG: hypothetical protein KAT46_07890 [Deltaproteobacteria bacterium]|nr:hypothetical protein [Deltaproteobacteria bacterium]
MVFFNLFKLRVAICLSLFLLVALPLSTPSFARPNLNQNTSFLVLAEANPNTASKAFGAFNEGDYLKAIILYQLAIKEDPDNEVLVKNLSFSFGSYAREALSKDELSLAKENFEEALALNDEDVFKKGLAISMAGLGDLKEAAEVLEVIEDDAEALSLLASLYTRLSSELKLSGDTDLALEYYEKARATNIPLDKSFNKGVAKLRREQKAEAGFDKAEGSHFTVKFEGGENAEVGYIISLLLEEAYFFVGASIGYYPSASRQNNAKIGAVLYSKEQFRSVNRSAKWSGALYDGRIKIPIGGITEKTKLLENLIVHEYTHAVVHRISKGQAPVWLNEGLAQYLEGLRTKDKKAELAVQIDGKKISLRNLEGSFQRLSRGEAELAYALSLSATEYIINEFGLFSVRSILERLGKGQSLERAVSGSIYISYDNFEESWLASLR